ncbi:MAG: Hemin uptake protein HemP, partial [Devosia sp.]|nr:Hemin uptake protein HemP [Devosia sp.]
MPVAAEPSRPERREGDRKTIASAELFDGLTEVLILHN